MTAVWLGLGTKTSWYTIRLGFWLGLGTERIWLGLGTYHGLA